MKVGKFVFDTFLRLTSKTVPYGYEDIFFLDIMKSIFSGVLKKDKHGNYFTKIGESRTIFTSHIDTVSKNYIDVVHKFDRNIIRTDGKTTLGADDKAGMTVMLYMIKNRIPGLYYFFMGEEVGCIGSGLVAKYDEIEGKYDRVISFDRRGTNSVITFQSYGRCCSDEFANDLCNSLNQHNMSFEKDTGGVYTDSAEFVNIVPECTNISVGYYREHTTDEHQDIRHLIKLCNACIKIDWENLTTKRDPSVGYSYSYKDYEIDTYPARDEYEDDFGYFGCSPYSNRKNNKFENENGKNSEWKKTRRQKSRSYFSSGGTLYDVTNKINKSNISDEANFKNDKYSWILSKLCDDNFTETELENIKKNFLNLNVDHDKWFYEYLKEKSIK